MLKENNVLTGEEFIITYPNKKFYKLTNKQEIHNNLKFTDGLNIDPIEFNPNGKCSPGGIYFTEHNKIALWLSYSHSIMYWIREVYIPLDAKVYVEHNKFKSNKLIFGPRVEIQDFESWLNSGFCFLAVKLNISSLQYIANIQPKQIILMILKSNGLALQYVQTQTPELCLCAVQSNGLALQYVQTQTPKLCLCAVQSNGLALQYVQTQTPKICYNAVQSNGLALEYIKIKQNQYMCELAVRSNGLALKFVNKKNQINSTVRCAVRSNGLALKFVSKSKQTEYICKLALRSNPLASQYVCKQFNLTKN